MSVPRARLADVPPLTAAEEDTPALVLAGHTDVVTAARASALLALPTCGSR